MAAQEEAARQRAAAQELAAQRHAAQQEELARQLQEELLRHERHLSADQRPDSTQRTAHAATPTDHLLQWTETSPAKPPVNRTLFSASRHAGPAAPGTDAEMTHTAEL